MLVDFDHLCEDPFGKYCLHDELLGSCRFKLFWKLFLAATLKGLNDLSDGEGEGINGVQEIFSKEGDNGLDLESTVSDTFKS